MNKWYSVLTDIKKVLKPAPQKKLYIKRLVSENIVALLIQYIGLMMSPPSFSSHPLWFASGTACAFIFMRYYYILPGIWLGTFLVYFSEKMGGFFSIICASIFSLQAFLLLWSCHRFIGPSLLFYQLKTFFKWMGIVATLTFLTSAALLLVYSFKFSIVSTMIIGLQWWLANLLGASLFSFSILTLDAYFPEIDQIKKIPAVEWVPFILLFLFYALIILSNQVWAAMIILPCSVVLLLIIALRTGWCGALFALFSMGLLANLTALFPSFTVLRSFQMVIYFQLFLLLMLIFLLSTSIQKIDFYGALNERPR